MTKPTPQIVKQWDYHEMVKWVNKTYKVDIDNFKQYDGKEGLSDFDNWVQKTNHTPNRNSVSEYNQAVREGTYIEKYPFCSFWHYMLDLYPSISNGSEISVNWNELLTAHIEGEHGSINPNNAWRIDVIQLFVYEFGTEGDMNILIGW